MSTKKESKAVLKAGILQEVSGDIIGINISKNGVIRLQPDLPKRKRIYKA